MNNEEIEKALTNIANSDIGISISGRYTNTISLNGFIVQKPRITPNRKTGNETCSFILHQITKTINGYIVDKTFHVLCYLPNVVDRLKELENICFVNVVGTFERSRKYKCDYCQMYNFEINCELSEKFTKEYERGDMSV